MDKKSLYPYFEREMNENPELYVDSSNTFVSTYLAEAYLNENEDLPEDEEEDVYDAVIDWFEQWEGRHKYNND